MESKQTEVGWKKNIDKLLFILASFYIISAMVWLWKNQQQASAARSNKDSISEVKINQQDTKSSQTVNDDVKPSTSNSKLEDRQNPQPTLASQLMDSVSSETVIEQNRQQSPLSNVYSSPIETEEVISFSGNDNQSRNLSIRQSSSSLPVVSIPPPPPVSQPPQPSPLPVQIPPRPNKATSPRRLNRVPVIDKVSQDTISFANQPQSYSPSYPMGGSEDNLRNTLLGVVELENNSVALFNLNNLTEKVEVGSEIGATGWLLVGISGKQAILNRNNQSRYLMVGEKF